MYVYGSYLGATLATSLALTETRTHQRMAVRGLIASNGIYNWTSFLPDHRINQPTKTKSGKIKPAPTVAEGSPLHLLSQQLPVLFKSPTNLFDVFASPCLFFQTAGMLVPKSFTYSEEMSSMVDSLAGLSFPDSPLTLSAFKPPRRGSLVFPPRRSNLKIPEALFLYDTPPVPVVPATKRKSPSASMTTTAKLKRKPKPKSNSFEWQATELAALMKRSIDKVELKERRKWDEDFEGWDTEAERRVRVRDAGVSNGAIELTLSGQELVRQWLKERIV
jgi:hypothetical protein